MSKADFYILDSSETDDRFNFACRLAGKLTALGHAFRIELSNSEQTEQLDRLLWQQPAESFLPHQVHDNAIISEHAHDQPSVTINLGEKTVADSERVVEIVIQKDEVLRHTRARFSAYRDLGWEVTSHKMGST